MKLQATIVFQKNWEAIHEMEEYTDTDGTIKTRRKYKYIINEGSSRSSKTISLIDVFDIYARSNENKRLTVWRDTKTDCKKTVLNDTLKHFTKTGRLNFGYTLNKTESILFYKNGSTFEIHGTDDEETVHGLTQDVAWINEPYKISRDTFDQIDQRTSDFILLDWNPKKAHFIDDLKKDKRALVIKSTFRDNPFCPEESRIKILSYQPVKMASAVESKRIEEQVAISYNCSTNLLGFTPAEVEELARCQENERKGSASSFNWSVYGLGLKSEKPNRIFNWQEIPLSEYLQLGAERYYGVDWGAVDPWGVVEIKYYDGAIYIRELNYDSENTIRAKLSLSEQNQISGQDEGLVKWRFGKLNIETTKTIICDNNRPKKILGLRKAGWEYARAAVKGADSIKDGIDTLNNLKVYFTSDSENLRYEQENYSRKVDHYGVILEDPEDQDNHLIDPIRYVVQYLQHIGVIKTV